MSIKEQLTLAAGLAVALSTAALYPLFSPSDWLWRVLGAVLAVVVAGLISRRVAVPRLLQPLVAAAFLGGYLADVFAGETLRYSLIPTGKTLDTLTALVSDGRADVQRFAPPVPTTTGLVLLSAAGVGAIAILVDVVAVVVDRAAMAGLPLLLLFAIPSAVVPGGLGGLPFVLGAIGWLGLLLVEGSERVGRWGAPMRSAQPGARPGGDDSSLGRVGRRIGLSAVGMAVVVPLLVPGLDHRLLAGNGGASSESGGSSSARTYNPITRLKDQLELPDPVQLLQYQTDDPEPDYLRMTTLDVYTGAGWQASELSQLRDRSQVQKGIKRPVGDGGPHRQSTTTIQVDGDHLAVFWLPVPFGPTRVKVKGTWLWDSSSQTVFSASRTTKGLPAYVVSAERALPDRATLAIADGGAIDPSIRKKYSSGIAVSPFVASLTARLVAGQPTEYDKAVALQSFFTNARSHFVYDLTASQPLSGEDPLEAFLKGRHGFCEQFATAMAAMLRLAGIPSRVAVGFTKGTLLRGTHTYSVTTHDAHAWPEAWFAGTGWVRFEPTPAQSGASVPDYSLPTSAAPSGNDPTAVVPTPSAAPAGPADRSEHHDLFTDAGAPGLTQTKKVSAGTSAWLLFLPVAIVVLAVLPFLLTLVRRRRRLRHPDPLSAWSQLEDDARDIGYVWHGADSPRAAAVRLAAGHPLPAPAFDALNRLARAAERVRYAPPSRHREPDRAFDMSDVAAVRSGLWQTSSTGARLRAQLFAPSTLTWATRGVGDRVGRVLDAVDEAIATVTRPLRRRVAPR